MTLPPHDSPPLAPEPFLPNPEQIRFLDLHRHHIVTVWRWHLMETQLRAYTDRGRAATIWRDNLDELVRAGLMEHGAGFDMKLTNAGREACKAEERV